MNIRTDTPTFCTKIGTSATPMASEAASWSACRIRSLVLARTPLSGTDVNTLLRLASALNPYEYFNLLFIKFDQSLRQFIISFFNFAFLKFWFHIEWNTRANWSLRIPKRTPTRSRTKHTPRRSSTAHPVLDPFYFLEVIQMFLTDFFFISRNHSNSN